MAILPTKDAIVRFDENEDRLNTFINSTGTYSTNSGLPDVETLPSFMQRNSAALNLLASTNVKGAWAASTTYSVWDEVQYSGTWYRCVVAHTSTGTFDSTKWRISQGVTVGALAASSGANAVGYSSAYSYAAGTVGFELSKKKSVFSTGNASTDVPNIQNAINSAADYTIIEFFGTTNFVTNSTITLRPKIWLIFNGVGITHTSTSADLFSYITTGGVGFPGQIIIQNLVATGAGTSGSANMLKIDANCPFVLLKNCFMGQFYGGIYLRNCYGSVIDQCQIYNVSHGIRLMQESHAANIRDCLIDSASIAAFSINYGNGADSGTTHNVTIMGGAFQNSAVGVWLEKSLEFHSFNLYHEGNTVNDYRIGVADSGGYNRSCYNTVIDGFSSSSLCASGKNIQIEHSVGVQIRAAAWNSGCSTTNTLLSYDGYCDKVDVDILRYTTSTVTNTAPVDFTVNPSRGVLRYKGRYIFGEGQTDAIQFGNLANVYGALYQGFTSGGRKATTLESKSQDLQIRAPEIIRLQDSSGNDVFVIDHLNSKIVAQKSFQMSSQQLENSASSGSATALPATPKGYWVTIINGNVVKIPYYAY